MTYVLVYTTFRNLVCIDNKTFPKFNEPNNILSDKFTIFTANINSSYNNYSFLHEDDIISPIYLYIDIECIPYNYIIDHLSTSKWLCNLKMFVNYLFTTKWMVMNKMSQFLNKNDHIIKFKNCLFLINLDMYNELRCNINMVVIPVEFLDEFYSYRKKKVKFN